MLKSMTGYGHAQFDDDNLFLNVEIKALNSKFLDASFKLPKILLSKELEIRKIITENMVRGKVNLTVDIISKNNTVAKSIINKSLFRNYFDALTDLAKEVELANADDLFKLALQMPEVVVTSQGDELDDTTWQIFTGTLNNALQDCIGFRQSEGAALAEELSRYIGQIQKYLEEVIAQDPQRLLQVKERINKNLEETLQKANIDENRFEQELIYYIEKLDISEEKVRLQKHLDYFLEVMQDKQQGNGKKLAFISQEIGREINTIGSKANHASIQRSVIGMKEELERIKEQLLNII